MLTQREGLKDYGEKKKYSLKGKKEKSAGVEGILESSKKKKGPN